MTKKSVLIKNSDWYQFRLEMDDIVGIIRLTNNDTSKPTTRITDRNIPIDMKTKWEFYNERSGYNEIPNEIYNFKGSYIDRQKDYVLYNWWKNYITSTYRTLCIKERIV